MHRLRPVFSLAVVALASLIFASLYRLSYLSLARFDWMSGYTLASVCAIMLLLPLRKKLILLNWGPVAMWQQIHHFAGLFAIVVFAFHAGWSVTGRFEAMLAVVFLLLSFSGIGHWYFNRRVPILLRSAGSPLRREDMPGKRIEIAKQAYAVALASATDSKSACLAEFYTRDLASYFRRSRSFGYFLRPTGKLRRNLQLQLEAVGRYLNDDGHSARMKLTDLVKQRDDIDFQAVMTSRIRAWNMFHVTLTWAFVAMAALHIYTVFRFSGS
jgi:hypothetical protein